MKRSLFWLVFMFLAALPAVAEDRIDCRTYDISALTYTGSHESGQMISLVPFDPSLGWGARAMDLDDGQVKELDVSGESVHELLTELIGWDHFDHEGVSMETTGNTIILNGPEALHGKVAAVLKFVEQRLNRQIRLDIDVYRVKDGQTLNAGQMEPLLSRSDKVFLGDLLEIRDGKTVQIVYDYEPEIAQGAVIAEPIITTLFVGLSLFVRPVMAADGKTVNLALCGTASSLLEPLKSRELDFSGMVVMNEKWWQSISTGDNLDDPKITFASVASTVQTEPGKAATVQVAFPHASGLGCLQVVLTAHPVPVPEKIDLGDGTVLGACSSNHILVEALLPLWVYRDSMTRWYWHELEQSSTRTTVGPNARLVFAEPGRLEEYIFNMGSARFNALDPDFLDSVRLHHLGGEAYYVTSPEGHALLLDVARSLFSQPSRSVMGELHFVEVEGPAVLKDGQKIAAQGTLVGKVLLPMMPGSKATALAGLEGLMVVNYDVDVATNSAIANPNPEGYLDGAFIHLRHEPDASGEGSAGRVRTKIVLQRLMGDVDDRHLGARGGALGHVDLPRFQMGIINTHFDGDGKIHVLGALTMEGDGGVKTLYTLGTASFKQ